MKNHIQGVFFDCWDTLITFRLVNPAWNYQTLKDHCLNQKEIDWSQVDEFCNQFYQKYYQAHLDYEVKVKQVLNLMVLYFSMQLDCPLEQCTHEILIHLDPQPVEGVKDFLSFLETKNIFYACLSNTIYEESDTKALLDNLLKDHPFPFVLTSGDVAVKKPNPIFFQTGVKMAKLDIKDCIYIGDKLLQDAYGSYKAGFAKSIFLDWKNQQEKQSSYMKKEGIPTDFDYIRVTSYQELQDIFSHDEMA